MPFLDDSYLIGTPAGRRIFASIRNLPVVDPHSHADIGELRANRNYPDLWTLLVGSDHYIWSLERCLGVPEEFITGGRPNREKFRRLAEVFPAVAGNPVYEWIHLDLKRCLKIDAELGPDTAGEIWREGNARLAEPEFRPLQLLTGPLNVEVICSTDDPLDRLEEHGAVNAVVGKPLVRPTWRPDRAMNIGHPDWLGYLGRLEARFGRKIGDFNRLIEVLEESHDYFARHGCLASDHGVELPPNSPGHAADAEAAFRKALGGERLSAEETAAYQERFLLETAALDAAKGWVFQLHSGPVRNVRHSIHRQCGPDSGGDVSSHHQDLLPGLLPLLNRFDENLKTVLYCLDPGHQNTLAVAARAFGTKVRLGSAWWFNDTPVGMKRQLELIGDLHLLANFAGMVSDSRKLLSCGSRFEMFRRVFSDVLGNLAESGRTPEEVIRKIAIEVAYEGPKRFFGF